MLIPVPPKFRKNRKLPTRAGSASPPPVVGPVLTSADFDPDSGKLELEFDRNVSIAEFVPTAIVVNDPDSGSKYVGIAASVGGGIDVEVLMNPSGAPSGSQKWMTASGANGIIATDGSGEWVGVTELGLPYP